MANEQSSEFTVLTLAIGFALFGAGFAGIEYFGSSDFVKTGLPLVAFDIGGYNSDHFVAISIGTVCLPLACSFLIQGSWRSQLSIRHVAAHTLLSIVFFLLSSVMYHRWRGQDLISCGLFMCAFYGSNWKKGDTANGYFQMLAVPLFLLFIVLGHVHILLVCRLALLKYKATCQKPEIDDLSSVSSQSTQSLETALLDTNSNASQNTLRPKKMRKMVMAAGEFVAIILLGFISSIFIPNGWLNWTGHKIRVNAIEVVDTDSAFRDHKFGLVMRPEVPGAIFRTWAVELNDHVIAKVYPDVYLFYAYLVVTTLLVRAAEQRFKVWVLAATSAIFMACFIHAWWFHNWHGWWGGIEGFIVKEPSVYEKWARTIGQVASCLLGILCAIIGKDSPFNFLAAVSWERAVIVHKFIGNLFLMVLLGHIILWWRVFDDQGVFPHDALSGIVKAAPTFFPLNFHAKPGQCSTLQCLDPAYNKPAADNFTIPLMNLICFYVVLPVFGVLTWNRVRRERFELFYILHSLMASVVILATLWHAAASLVFLLPGMLVLLLDNIRRYVTASTDRRIASVSVLGDDRSIVTFSIEPPIKFLPGQFICVNIPSISQVQFHPFSISSSTSLTIHARCLGDFTNSLANLSKGESVIIQGPYGFPPKLRGRSCVIFVAGGIGITPIASLLADLVLAQKTDIQVLLIWSARNGRQVLFPEFHAVLEAISLNVLIKSFVKLMLFDTSADRRQEPEDLEGNLNVNHAAVTDEVINMKMGRPNLKEEVRKYLGQYQSSSIDVLKDAVMYTCGPPALVNDAHRVADECGLEFHEELFDL